MVGGTTMSLWRNTVLGASGHPVVREFVKGNQLARPLRNRFVAGETLDDALQTGRSLNRAGFRASLDHLGEDVGEPEAAEAAVAAYLALVEAVARSGVRSGISIKLSQLGLAMPRHPGAAQTPFAACQARLERLLATAQAAGVFVRIDMEGSAHTQATLDMLHAVWPRYQRVGVVLQAYLHRTGADLEDVLALGATVRLCKGAYSEAPEIAYQARDEVDAAYARLATRMLEAPNYAAIATHDPALIAHARAEAARLHRASDSFEFQMLYGVRRDLQHALVRAGYRLRVYVPYGREWYPYLTRRLAERPGNLLFLVRSLWAEQRGDHASAA
jgi:proline dehydrogenase